MHQCPSCKSQSISYGAAWNSSSRHPLMCPACRELSYVPAPQSFAPLGSAILLLLGSGLAAWILHSIPVFLGGLMLAVIYYIARWRSEKKLVAFNPQPLVQEQSRWGPYVLIEAIAAIFTFQ